MYRSQAKKCIFVVLCSFMLLERTSALALESEMAKGEEQLAIIHSKLPFFEGNLLYEYPEQLMTVMHLPSNAKVLELGGNVGRNTCVIATILEDSRNLVSLEPSNESAKYLRKNRDVHGLNFHIEESAVSKVPLVQAGWISIPSEVELPGHFRINTIAFSDLEKKYDIEFDTLVADCEGALYYILKDDPEILKNINLIIVENDYPYGEHFRFVIDLFKASGFELVYSKAYGNVDCSGDYCFYQVWKRST